MEADSDKSKQKVRNNYDDSSPRQQKMDVYIIIAKYKKSIVQESDMTPTGIVTRLHHA